jgi:NADH-quinone oxidoreductase subunit L
MAIALGVGAWIPAIFHLFTHAFFKGLLFLGAGSVIHGMHEEQDMRRMGGLKKYMPVTYWTFLIGAAANAGIIPLAGFWSKDEIIVGAWVTHNEVIAIVALVAALFTSLYMFRAVFMTFHGKERFDTHHIHPHDPPMSMKAPLILLAIPAALVGFLGFPPENGWFHHFLEHSFSAAEHHVISNTTTIAFGVISTAVAVGGLGLAAAAYLTGSINPVNVAQRFGPLYRLAANRWYFDEIYERFIVHPLYQFSVFLWRVVDVQIIDGTVNGTARLMQFTSERWRQAQTGLVANYALMIVVGAVLIIGGYLVFSSNLFQ